MQAYRFAGAMLGWFAILAQYWLSVSASGFTSGSVTYFSFFTILGNILVALAFAAPLLPNHKRDSFFSRPGVRTAIGVYIFVVAVIFYLLLRNLFHPVGLGWFVNILLHYIMPPLYLVDWVLFTPKRGLVFRQLLFWLIFPLTYVSFTLIHGAVSGFYPYPFLDAGTYGYGEVSINIAGLTLSFIIVSAGFIVAGRNMIGLAER